MLPHIYRCPGVWTATRCFRILSQTTGAVCPEDFPWVAPIRGQSWSRGVLADRAVAFELMVNLQLRACSSLHDGLCMLLSVFCLSLNLWNRRNIITGLGMRPFRTGHSFFCHIIASYISCRACHDRGGLSILCAFQRLFGCDSCRSPTPYFCRRQPGKLLPPKGSSAV